MRKYAIIVRIKYENDDVEYKVPLGQSNPAQAKIIEKMLRLLAALIQATTCVLLLASCASVTGPRGDVGHYQLVSVNGLALPAPSAIGAYRSGSLELRADSSFVDVIVIGGVVDSVFGRYVVGADSIRMTPSNWDHHYAVQRTGDEIRAAWGEGVFLYRRD